MDKKYIKTFWNEKFFELPSNKIKSRITALKFNYLNNKIDIVYPYIFLCNKTTIYDKLLISNTLQGNYVFLKDEVIQKIYEDSIPESEMEELIDCIKKLKDAFISIVIFPEKNITIFGNSSKLPDSITMFLHHTTYNLKFLNLVGTYFAMPIWSPEFRRCETRFSQQFTINFADTTELNSDEINDAINAYMPSSATIYSHRYNPYIRSNKKAQNLETIIYCCPNCKKLFTLYSEFNCLKCKDCGTAVEFSSNGTILLSSNITDLDSFAEFQFNELNKQEFNNKPMIDYTGVKVIRMFENAIKDMGLANVKIYCNKVQVNYPDTSKNYSYHDVVRIEFDRNNTVILTMKDKEKLILSGNKNVNFYIIHDLLKIIKTI